SLLLSHQLMVPFTFRLSALTFVMPLPPGFRALSCVLSCRPATFRCRAILLAQYLAFRDNPVCCLNRSIFAILYLSPRYHKALQIQVWSHRGISSTSPKRRAVLWLSNSRTSNPCRSQQPAALTTG